METRKGPRDVSRGPFTSSSKKDQLTRFQVWPPQNMPPKAQPCTRSEPLLFIDIVESYLRPLLGSLIRPAHFEPCGRMLIRIFSPDLTE